MTIQNIKIFRNILSPVIILIVAGSFVYFFNLNNGLFWDDDDWIINNNSVHSISWSNVKFWLTNNTLAGVGLKSNYYRPFLFLTFAFNYVMSGTKPLVYHLTSNAIHVFNGILVFSILYFVFRRKLLAFLTALFFTIHPLQAEAITYISGRGDALAAMFMLLALLLFYKSQLTKIIAGLSYWRSSTFYFLLSTFFLILGLLSRETGIIFPVLALAFYISVLSKDGFFVSIKNGLIKAWPYFAIVFIYGILRLTVLNFQNTLNFYAEPNLYSENLHVRLLTFLPVLWEYLKLLIVPVGLHMERSSIVYTSFFEWPVWPVALGLAALVAWLFFLYKKEKTGFRMWLFGTLWFFIALGPVSGITPINAVMYEHWLYLPMVGFWVVVSFYLVKLFDYLKDKRNVVGYWLLAVGLVLYFSFFVYQSIQRNIIWGKPIEFYEDILKHEPESARIMNNLGNQYFNKKDIEKAEFYYKQAINAESDFSQPYYNLGTILQSRGDMYGAIKLYERATEINPGFFYPYQNLSVIYAQQGNLDKAIENVETLKILLPTNPRVFYNSALIYIALNKRDKALEDLRMGLNYIELDSQTGELIRELIEKLKK